MISFEQCKHVITYYIQKLMSPTQLHISPHIQRDCVFLGKQRGEICANISSDPTMNKIIHLLHNADNIHQINSIPENNKCFIDNKSIPKNSSGVQLIIYTGNQVDHICIQKKYQKICYAYFKIRHFDEFIEKYIKDWLIKQHWYIPGIYTVKQITDKVLTSQIPQAIHTHLIASIDTLTAEEA